MPMLEKLGKNEKNDYKNYVRSVSTAGAMTRSILSATPAYSNKQTINQSINQSINKLLNPCFIVQLVKTITVKAHSVFFYFSIKTVYKFFYSSMFKKKFFSKQL